MPLLLERPAPGEYLEYYEKYIARVPNGDIIETLARNADETLALLRSLRDMKGHPDLKADR